MLTTTTTTATALAVTALGAALAARGSPASPPAAIPFDEARIFLEYNATDDDAEVVIEVDAELGLGRLVIVGPGGNEVLDVSAPQLGLGLRKFALETPEPSLHAVLGDYPAGNYRFYGRAVTGEFLFSVVPLFHALPAAPSLIYPLEGDTGVPTSGAAALWAAGPDAAGFFVELESDDLGTDVKANLPGSASSFGFPGGFLEPLTEYQLGIGARSASGNLTVVEIDFTTGP